MCIPSIDHMLHHSTIEPLKKSVAFHLFEPGGGFFLKSSSSLLCQQINERKERRKASKQFLQMMQPIQNKMATPGSCHHGAEQANQSKGLQKSEEQ